VIRLVSRKKFLKIKSFIFDVDGVLTNGNILVTTKGEMHREMNTKDGYALKRLIAHNFPICIISGGTDEGVRIRLKLIGIKEVHLGVLNKFEYYQNFLNNHQIKPEEVIYMGDDLPDWEVMKDVGIAACPKDSVKEIKKIAHYISRKKGGEGCVREVIEKVLRIQKKWK